MLWRRRGEIYNLADGRGSMGNSIIRVGNLTLGCVSLSWGRKDESTPDRCVDETAVVRSLCRSD